MNICVFSLITARHGQIGGMETHGNYLWHGLAVRGHSVHVVSTRHPEGVIDEEIEGVQYHYLPNVPTGSSGGLWRRYSVDKLHEIQEAAPVDLLCSQSHAACHLAQDSSRRGRLPLVAIMHGYPFLLLESVWREIREAGTGFSRIVRPFLSSLRNYLFREMPLLRGADRIIATSDWTKKALRSWYFLSPDKIDAVPFGISLEHFTVSEEQRRKVREDLGVLPEEALLLYVSTVSRQKGAHIALQATAHLIAQGRPVKLLVVGGGKELQDMQRLCTELELDKYTLFTGPKSNLETPPYYQSCDIFLFPTLRTESFGIVLIEAMAAGKPIIASRLGAIPSVIDEEQTGILIRPGEVSELVEAIEDLLDSPERAAKLSSQGIRQAELLYDKERMIDKTLETFRKAVSGN